MILNSQQNRIELVTRPAKKDVSELKVEVKRKDPVYAHPNKNAKSPKQDRKGTVEEMPHTSASENGSKIESGATEETPGVNEQQPSKIPATIEEMTREQINRAFRAGKLKRMDSL